MIQATCNVCGKPIHMAAIATAPVQRRWVHDQPYNPMLPPIHAPRPKPIGATDLITEYEYMGRCLIRRGIPGRPEWLCELPSGHQGDHAVVDSDGYTYARWTNT